MLQITLQFVMPKGKWWENIYMLFSQGDATDITFVFFTLNIKPHNFS